MTVGGVPINVDGISTVGLVVLFGLALARGWLFTKRQYDEVVHDRGEWRTAHRISEAARLEMLEHQRASAEAAATTNQLMRGLQARLDARGPRIREGEDG